MHPVVRFTDATDGSFGLREDPAALGRRRRSITAWPLTWLTQVHGAGVVVVNELGQGAGSEADAAVTALPGAALSVITADCAPVVLTTAHAVGAVHAGWRGLVAGVVQAAVAALQDLTDDPVTAWLGPCIRPRCYEFGGDDLDVVAARFGPGVRSTTAWGTPALDVPASVRAALGEVSVTDVRDTGVCTACSAVHHSHRVDSTSGRQAAFVWLEP